MTVSGSIGHLLITVSNFSNDGIHPGALLSNHQEGTATVGLASSTGTTAQLNYWAAIHTAPCAVAKTVMGTKLNQRRARTNVRWENAPPSPVRQAPETQQRETEKLAQRKTREENGLTQLDRTRGEGSAHLKKPQA